MSVLTLVGVYCVWGGLWDLCGHRCVCVCGGGGASGTCVATGVWVWVWGPLGPVWPQVCGWVWGGLWDLCGHSGQGLPNSLTCPPPPKSLTCPFLPPTLDDPPSLLLITLLPNLCGRIAYTPPPCPPPPPLFQEVLPVVLSRGGLLLQAKAQLCVAHLLMSGSGADMQLLQQHREPLQVGAARG